ncbi:MAG: hypothetical protein Kow0031_13470 [Anaerolineae bacterium]
MINMDLSKLPRWLRDWLPVILWMALIFALSSRSKLVELDSKADEIYFFKTAHIAAYAMLMWLWWRALSPRREAGWRQLWAAFALTVLYGISDEFHQLFVPGRTGQLADVLFDAAGALAMLFLLRRVAWLRALPESLWQKRRPADTPDFKPMDADAF